MSGSGIAFAPALLPDELLYSWLARLAALNALGAPRNVLQRFFGCCTLVPSVDLPSRVLALGQRLGGWLPFATLDELLEHGTLLPYHRPFLAADIYSRVHNRLQLSDGKGLKTLMGRVANRFGAHPTLRSCPGCLADSWSRYGSLYWMRQHQLPGVNCCAIHGTTLQRTTLQARTHRQRLLLPAFTQGTQPDGKADARQLRFARLSQDLVEAALPTIAPLLRAATYRGAALALGFGTPRGHVDFYALAGAIRRHFDDFEGFDHQARLLATSANPLGWLRPLFDKPHRSLHPICHLLLVEFLFNSVEAFKAAFSACEMAPHARLLDDPFLVKAAQALGTSRATHADASSSARMVDHEDSLRDPSLSCRKVAALVGLSVSTVVAWRRARSIPIQERRKSLHPTTVEKVLETLSSLSSLPVVAAQTGVSLSSVYRILSQYPGTPRPHRDEAGISQGPLRRERWAAALQACQEKGTGGVAAARTHAGADYAWLYRNDRAWLALTTINTRRSFQHHNNKPPRVDWVRRDAELCQLLLQQLGLQRDMVPRRRLTKTLLLRPLGETMVRRNLDKLPELSALLDKVVEPAQAYRMRRVDHAIALLVKDGVHPRLWRIQRLAGLPRWSSVLNAYANKLLARLYAQNSLHTHGLS